MAVMCVQGFISGRVQGVFYRSAVLKEAKSRGLSGWVKNLTDGRVEVMICGEQEAVNDLHEWLWIGSKMSEVKSVEVHEVPWQMFTNFEVR